MEPIELSSDGLLLRGWRPEDTDAVHRACQDPLIQRWTTIPAPYGREHAEAFVGHDSAADWAAGTGAPLGIFDATTGELLGSGGLVRLALDMRVGEIGTWVAPWARGRGVAERAGRAVAHWAFELLALRRLTWWAEVGNHASRLVAERIGFAFDGVARAALAGRDGSLVDGWCGVLLRGEVKDHPAGWLAHGGPGARQAATFLGGPVRLPAGPVSLRELAERDIDDMTAACSDPTSARWTTVPVPYRRLDAEAFVRARGPNGWARGTAATFVIADSDDRFAGTVDLRLDPVDRSTAEIGYLVAPWARGKGYAQAAVRAICGWGFSSLALTRIVWRAHVGNDASRRVAERGGFTVEGVQRLSCEQRGERRDGWVGSRLVTDP